MNSNDEWEIVQIEDLDESKFKIFTIQEYIDKCSDPLSKQEIKNLISRSNRQDEIKWIAIELTDINTCIKLKNEGDASMDYCPKYKRAKEYYNYIENKDIKIKHIDAIYINNFRSLRDRKIELGRYITLITGKNGTMKSSILGLIAHPFSNKPESKDIFGNPLKTDMKNVFRLSLEKDNESYEYNILFTSNKDEKIIEPIKISLRENEQRHRVVVSGHDKGDGNFILNTNYMNLKRLFPMVDTSSQEIQIELTDDEKRWIANAYQRIIQKTEFGESATIQDKTIKYTCAPKNSYYDYNSISSGEDNLGFIILKLLAFKRYIDNIDRDRSLQGIICIDELEASLHPVSLINLFEFLYKFSKKNNIQIVFTTHSLHLMQYCIDKYIIQEKLGEEIKINNISTVQASARNYNIIINPEYSKIYKELTLSDIEKDMHEISKINIICEDEMAKMFIERIIKTNKIKKVINFIHDVSGDESGTSYTGLISLAKNGKKLLDDSIIIVDADVDNSKIKEAKNDFLLKIPDMNNFAIEKRIVVYLLELDDASDFFAIKEKTAIKKQMTDSDINIDLNEIKKDISSYIKQCKKWVESNSDTFGRAFTHYINNNRSYYDNFRKDIVSFINEKRQKKFLPPVEA